MKGAMGNLMRQAQKMQEDLQKAQEELANAEVTGESGGGLVKITMNGRHEVRRVEIDDSLVGDDKEMLEDLVAAGLAKDRLARLAERVVMTAVTMHEGGLNHRDFYAGHLRAQADDTIQVLDLDRADVHLVSESFRKILCEISPKRLALTVVITGRHP